MPRRRKRGPWTMDDGPPASSRVRRPFDVARGSAVRWLEKRRLPAQETLPSIRCHSPPPENDLPLPQTVAPRIVLAEPTYIYLRLLADVFGHRDARAAVTEVHGVEALCHLWTRALGDPDPRPRQVERFHAYCDHNHVRLCRSLHALQKGNPVAGRRRSILSDPGRVSDNARLVRSQISLAAAFRRPASGEAALVLHPGAAWLGDPDAAADTVTRVLIESAERAAALRVRICLETEPPNHWALCIGEDIGRLARVVENVNENCEKRGLPAVAAITMDLEHSLIAAWGREEEVVEQMDRCGRLIEHIHVVSPLDLFETLDPPLPAAWGKPVGLLRRRIFPPPTANAHRTIAPPEGDPRIERLVVAAVGKTNWRRIGVFNLEVLPPLYYLHRWRGRGATVRQTLAGIRRLKELFSGCPAR